MNMQSGQGYVIFQAGMKRLLGPLFQVKKRAKAVEGSSLANEGELKEVDDDADRASEWHPKPFEECKISERALRSEECKSGALVEQLQHELTAVKDELEDVKRLSRNALEKTLRDAQKEASRSERYANAVITKTKAQLKKAQAMLGEFEGLAQDLEDTEQELLEVGQRLEQREQELTKVKEELAMAQILLSNPELSNRASSARVPSETSSTIMLYARHMLQQAEEVAPFSSDTSDSDDDWRIGDAALALHDLDEDELRAHYAGEMVPGLMLDTPQNKEGQCNQAQRTRTQRAEAAPKNAVGGSKVVRKRVRFGQDLVLVLEKFVKEGGCKKNDIEFLKALLLVLDKEKKYQNFQEYSQKFKDKWRDFTKRGDLFASFRPFYFQHRE